MKNNNAVRDMTMLMDLYEMTMSMGYFQSGMADQIVYFDMFFRRTPDGAQRSPPDWNN